MAEHAKYAPSAAHRWLRCPGSVALEAQEPERTSAYAEEGTKAHALASERLNGQLATAPEDDDVFTDAFGEMGEHVLRYTSAVEKAADGKLLLVEQRVDFGTPLGIANQWGTVDAVIIGVNVLEIHDLKYGQGVAVDVEDNEQLLIYAIGAVHTFSYLGPFNKVKLAIHQVRLGEAAEWEVTMHDLDLFAAEVQTAIEEIEAGDESLVPGDEQCRFCRAKAACPALAALVQETVGSQFENLDEVKADTRSLGNNRIADALAKVDLVEAWCKALRERAFEELNAGRDIPGWKLVAGKRGSRAWESDDEAVRMMKSMRLKIEEMYDMSVISPTSAEKLMRKGVIGEIQWAKLRAIITQKEGKPHVAPLSDDRPSIGSVADKFPVLA